MLQSPHHPRSPVLDSLSSFLNWGAQNWTHCRWGLTGAEQRGRSWGLTPIPWTDALIKSVVFFKKKGFSEIKSLPGSQLCHCPPNLGPPKLAPQQTPKLAPLNIPRAGCSASCREDFCPNPTPPGGHSQVRCWGAGEPRGHPDPPPCPSPALLPTQQEHPWVKIEIQLPISWQAEHINRVTSPQGKSQHVQASPGR